MLPVVELVRMRLGEPAEHVHGDTVDGAGVSHSMVHLVGWQQAGHGAGLVHDSVDLFEDAPVVTAPTVDAPVTGLLVEPGDVADDPPAAVLMGAAARAGREDDAQDVKALGGVGMEEVPDRATGGVRLRCRGRELAGPGQEAIHRRPHRRDRRVLGQVAVENGRDRVGQLSYCVPAHGSPAYAAMHLASLGGVDIVAALFVENLEFRQVAGGSTRIDITGAFFSEPVAEFPTQITPHLVVLVRAPADDSGMASLEAVFTRDGEEVARNAQQFSVEPGTIEARCTITESGSTVIVPLTAIAAP